MKVRNYEKKGIIGISIGIVFIIEILFIINLIHIKMYQYEKIQGIIVKEDFVKIIITSKNKKRLYGHSKIYIKDKKEKYEIIEDYGIILKKNKEEYFEILLKIKTPKKLKATDTVDLMIQTEKKPLIDMFKIIWEGD